jgi:pyruvate dehydrogenase E2 component (dihydrolipoamide acetyltransferase)
MSSAAFGLPGILSPRPGCGRHPRASGTRELRGVDEEARFPYAFSLPVSFQDVPVPFGLRPWTPARTRVWTMAVPVLLPKLGMSMTEATIVAWHVREGDQVRAGQTLADVESDKTVCGLEAPGEGIVLQLLARPGQTFPVGHLLALIGAEGEQAVAAPGPAEPTPEKATKVLAAALPATGAPLSPPRGREVLGSPSARRVARELGIDLATVTGTGPQGRITSQDVHQAAGARRASPVSHNPGDRVVPLTPMRRAIAARVQASETIPQVTLRSTLDARGLVAARSERQAAGVKLTYDDLLIYLVGRALAEDGRLNASFEADGIRYHGAAHVGIAVALAEGLVVPVIRDAHCSSLTDIAWRRAELVDRARSRRLVPADTEGGTFTITNLGMYPVDSFGALINPPQAAILSVGRIRPQAVVAEGMVVARDMAELGLTFDHRVADGAIAGQFLALLIQRLEQVQVSG